LKILKKEEIHKIYWAASKAGLFNAEEEKAIYFYDFDCLKSRLDILKNTFPRDVLHAIAIKTHSTPEVLKKIVASGMGLEAASMEEVKLALDAGISPDKLVFDSPVKTRTEIAYCHKELPGIYVNANSLAELSRYPKDFNGRLGLRINPLVSSDAPSIFDVAQKKSKFGVPISESAAIESACLKYPIEGLHLHIGSGIKDFSGNIEAIGRVARLAKKINRMRPQKPLSFLDIGGGIDFEAASGSPFSVESFVSILQSAYPEIFQDFQVITEYGKFVHKNNAFAVSKIEYVNQPFNDGETGTAFIHLGADLFLRKVYAQLNIQYPYSVHYQTNKEKQIPQKYNIAGPLCFAGDFLYHDLHLQPLHEGDLFFIYQVGANTLSMWSRHCSRKEPIFIGVQSSKLLEGH